jgi:isopentenyl diphosphate isomerase/L-lactate dehydrogenase-like FMN-dependent dehydrogenase
MDDYVLLHEIVLAAKGLLSPAEWDLIVGGAETETTLCRNRTALDRLAFRPRVLRDVSKLSWNAQIFGAELRLPLFLAPIGTPQGYGGGPVAAAQAARDFGCGMILSSVSPSAALEQVAAEANRKTLVYQLYVRGDEGWVKAQVDRAVTAGCAGFAVTVDTPLISRRERDLANRFMVSRRRHFPNAEFQAAFNWEKLARLRDYCRLPLIVKGIQTPEDADRAVGLGIDAIYVSNHGGRQPDHCLGSMEILAPIVDCVKKRAKIIVDGGLLRGTDIVKAIALGADAVGVGKLFCLALAANGSAGVMSMLNILENEVEVCLGLLGILNLLDANSDCLIHDAFPPQERNSHLRRAFPLLDSI